MHTKAPVYLIAPRIPLGQGRRIVPKYVCFLSIGLPHTLFRDIWPNFVFLDRLIAGFVGCPKMVQTWIPTSIKMAPRTFLEEQIWSQKRYNWPQGPLWSTSRVQDGSWTPRVEKGTSLCGVSWPILVAPRVYVGPLLISTWGPNSSVGTFSAS